MIQKPTLSTNDLKAQLVDPKLHQVAKDRRDYHYNTVLVPSLRVVGLALIVISVFFHLKHINKVDPLPAVAKLTLLYATYGVLTWLFLRTFYKVGRGLHWGDLFLALDPALWMVALYVTGADNSLLFFVLLARVADQTNSTFLRCIHYLNITALTYFVLLVWLDLRDYPLDWPLQGAKMVMLYLAGLYISLTALTAQRLRQRTRQAVHLAKSTIDELAQQNEELARARAAAEEVSRLKTGFLATMSHELRTPLNSVIGFSQLLEDPGSGELNDRQKRYLNNSLSSARRLQALIGDILDFSKLEAGALELDFGPVDLRILLRQSVEAISVNAAARGVSLIETYPAELAMAMADGFRLRQVCDNLLSNAVKYNIEGGEIRISARQHDAAVVMAIEDTGPGISPEHHRRVFDAFVQLDDGYQRKTEGTGLGLALCLALCQLQQADLRLLSPLSDQGGTCFEVWLQPYRREPGQGLPSFP